MHDYIWMGIAQSDSNQPLIWSRLLIHVCRKREQIQCGFDSDWGIAEPWVM